MDTAAAPFRSDLKLIRADAAKMAVTTGSIAVQRSQSVLAHETRYSIFAACLPGFTKVKKEAWGPVDAVAGVERRPDQPKQPCILLTPLRNRLSKPLVVTAASNPQNSAHHLDFVLLLMRLDEPVGLPDSACASLCGHCGPL